MLVMLTAAFRAELLAGTGMGQRNEGRGPKAGETGPGNASNETMNTRPVSVSASHSSPFVWVIAQPEAFSTMTNVSPGHGIASRMVVWSQKLPPSRRGVRDCGIGVLLLVNDRLGNHDADWGLSGRSFSERAAFQKNLA